MEQPKLVIRDLYPDQLHVQKLTVYGYVWVMMGHLKLTKFDLIR